MSLTLKSLSTTGGYLEDATIEFSEGLTCIIGARGTCKSTVVETIRFLFNCDDSRIQEMLRESSEGANGETPSHKGLLHETLRASVARCEVNFAETGKSEVLTLERDVSALEPRIYRDGVKELGDKAVLNCVEIYSQGELQGIAADGKRRLDLIDRPNKTKIDQLLQSRQASGSQLKELGNNIRARKAGIEARRAEIKSLEAYRQQLKELESKMPKLPTELEIERQRFTERKALLEEASKLLAIREEALSRAEPLFAGSEGFSSAALNLFKLGNSSADDLGGVFNDFAIFLSDVKAALEGQRRDTTSLYRKLEESVEVENARYYELRQSEQEINESLRTQDRLRQQIAVLERIQAEVDASQLELRRAEDTRRRLRLEISDHSDTIFKLRLEQVDQINKQFSEKVVLALTQSSLSNDYRARIISLLEGSRLRQREEIAKDLSNKLLPSELVDAIETGDSNRLAELLDRDLGQMARLVSYLGDSPDLYELETQIFEDELDITLFDEGIPKRVDQLSKGQKATAILPLILRSADYPLIFDQPEDDLDNRFIYATLVEIIRELKGTRQLIFVTHNANIPVLGDAEKVVVMKMETPKKAAPPGVGNVDEVKEEILSLLEGGAEAFKRRQTKYGSLLT
jgi:ABC-type enterochelin transport system ATPase subunit